MDVSALVKPFNIAVLISSSGLSTDVLWWCSPLQFLSTQKKIAVVAVWSDDEAVATSFAQKYFPSATAYWGYKDTRTHEAAGQKSEGCTLNALANTPEDSVAGFFVVAPSNDEKHIMKVLLAAPPRHIFTSVFPSWEPQTFAQMIQGFSAPRLTGSDKKHHKGGVQQAKVWSCSDPMKFEPAVATLQSILPELGPLVGGSFYGACLPVKRFAEPSSALDCLSESCVVACSLLRKIFGNVSRVSGIKSDDKIDDEGCSAPDTTRQAHTAMSKKTAASRLCYSGWLHFTGGTSCVITLQANSTLPILELRVWGTLGHVSLTWNASKDYYEVKRYLQHFEHPSLHPSIGGSWCISAWIETCLGFSQSNSPQDKNVGNEKSRSSNDLLDALVDNTLAYGLLTSSGTLVSVTPVTLQHYQSKMMICGGKCDTMEQQSTPCSVE